MDVESIASVSVIIEDGAAAAFYRDILGLAFEGGEGDYVFTEKLPGVRHFGLWPLSEAATACFGSDQWPDEYQRPQASIEFEVGSVADVGGAAEELEQSGYTLLHAAKEEPWGQTITRLVSEEGLIVGVCYTPWFHDAP